MPPKNNSLKLIKVLYVWWNSKDEPKCVQQTIFAEDLKYVEVQKEIQILSIWDNP